MRISTPEARRSRSRMAIEIWLLLFTIGLVFNGCDSEDKMTFKKGELFYVKKQVPDADAKGIGEMLLKDSMFSDRKETSAKLLKPESTYQLFIVMNKAKTDEDVLKEVRSMALNYSEDALRGSPLDILLTDSLWMPFDTIHYRSLGAFIPAKDGKLFYSTEAGKPAASALADFLLKDGFFDGGGKILKLEKDAAGYVVDLYSTPGERPPDRQEALRLDMKFWSTKAFNGVPVTLKLCDIDMKPFQVILPARTPS